MRDRSLALGIKQALEPVNNPCADQHQTSSRMPQDLTQRQRPQRMGKPRVRLYTNPGSSPPTYAASPAPAVAPTSPSVTQQKMVTTPTRSSSPETSSNPRESPLSSGIPGHLSLRGRGNHTCPHGVSCKLGGVGLDGELTVFGRNSAFKYVLA